MDTGQAIEDDRPSSRHNIEEALVGLGHMRKKRKVKSMKAKRETSRKRREECEEDGNEDDFWIA